MDVDDDLDRLDRDELIAEVRRLRAGIRAHRDSSGHDLCWHHPLLWGLLPEPVEPEVAVPPWPRFLRGCVRYRESLDRELPAAQFTIESSSHRSGCAPTDDLVVLAEAAQDHRGHRHLEPATHGRNPYRTSQVR